jgi:hypothetical protein
MGWKDDYDNSCELKSPDPKPKRSDLYEDGKPAQVQGFTTVARRVRGDTPGNFQPIDEADRDDKRRDDMSDMPVPAWLIGY